MLRSPSFLVTSVAAIGGLSAIGAVPHSHPSGGGAAGGQITAPATFAAQEPFAEVGGFAGGPGFALDAADQVQPVAIDSLTLLGAGDERSLLTFGDPGDVGDVSGSDVLDPAQFVAVGTDDAVDAEAPEAEEPEDDTEASADEPAPLVYEAADGELVDPDRIRTWLTGRGYPLADYAEELVAAGIEHDVDPRLVVGIAVIESSGGKRLPPSTHNAWGWSGNGPHGLKSWSSWPEAIDGFTEGLSRVYDTDNVDERMARKYVPPNWEKWLRTVRWVINDI